MTPAAVRDTNEALLLLPLAPSIVEQAKPGVDPRCRKRQSEMESSPIRPDEVRARL